MLEPARVATRTHADKKFNRTSAVEWERNVMGIINPPVCCGYYHSNRSNEIAMYIMQGDHIRYGLPVLKDDHRIRTRFEIIAVNMYYPLSQVMSSYVDQVVSAIISYAILCYTYCENSGIRTHYTIHVRQ